MDEKRLRKELKKRLKDIFILVDYTAKKNFEAQEGELALAKDERPTNVRVGAIERLCAHISKDFFEGMQKNEQTMHILNGIINARYLSRYTVLLAEFLKGKEPTRAVELKKIYALLLEKYCESECGLLENRILNLKLGYDSEDREFAKIQKALASLWTKIEEVQDNMVQIETSSLQFGDMLSTDNWRYS